MGHTVRSINYFHVTIKDLPGEALTVLTRLADAGVNLLAFAAVPIGSTVAQLTLFPEDPEPLIEYAARAGLRLSEPARALLVQGDDEVGALVGVHRQLAEAGVDVYASNGVSDGGGRYGYILHLRANDYETAARILGI